jgi:hypothetical protein
MFLWYQQADICYVFLEDIETLEQMEMARWFTRGWTLQELLAPKKLQFFNYKRQLIGDKQSLSEHLAKITGINQIILSGDDSLDHMYRTSIAQRMSWASSRLTAKAEDMAYSLFGIFNVSMPLLYGEGGPRAFERLQEEIIKQSTDKSFLAWNPLFTFKPSCLAQHPLDFKESNKIFYDRSQSVPFAMDNRGLQIQLRIAQRRDYPNKFIGLLDCTESMDSKTQIGIPLISVERTGTLFIRESTYLNIADPQKLALAYKRKKIWILRTPPIRSVPMIWFSPIDSSSPQLKVSSFSSSGLTDIKPPTRPVQIASNSRFFSTVYNIESRENSLICSCLAVTVDILDLHNCSATLTISEPQQPGQPDTSREDTSSAQISNSRQSKKVSHTQPDTLSASIKWEHDYFSGRDVLVVDVKLIDSSISDRLFTKAIFTNLIPFNFLHFCDPILEYMGEEWLWLIYPLRLLNGAIACLMVPDRLWYTLRICIKGSVFASALFFEGYPALGLQWWRSGIYGGICSTAFDFWTLHPGALVSIPFSAFPPWLSVYMITLCLSVCFLMFHGS